GGDYKITEGGKEKAEGRWLREGKFLREDRREPRISLWFGVHSFGFSTKNLKLKTNNKHRGFLGSARNDGARGLPLAKGRRLLRYHS
ncbi:MAG: hypothetical protein QXN96_06250, partial [Candidatus Bathyarchaeia archaeon]